MTSVKREDALEIHAAIIERYGGLAGVRDIGSLDAAVNRPQSGYYQDEIAAAAALWESLVQNHPFVDGNKRTGFACTSRYLKTNGLAFPKRAIDQVEDFVIGLLEAGKFTRENLEIWMREHVIRRSHENERDDRA